MPWSASDAPKGCSDPKKWARVANSILRDCEKGGGKHDECAGKAKRIANSKVK